MSEWKDGSVVFVLEVLCLVLIALGILNCFHVVNGTRGGGRGGGGKPASQRSFLPPANPQMAGLGSPAARADPGRLGSARHPAARADPGR